MVKVSHTKSIMRFLIFINTPVLLAVLTKGYTVSDSFHRCHINDEKLDRCLAASIEHAIKTIGSHGIPALNFPPIDPFKIMSLKFSAGTTAVNMAQNYSNVKIYGFSDVTVENAHLDQDRKTLSFTSFHPEIRQEAKYSINGKIFVVPVNGKGNSNISLYKPLLQHTLFFEEETRINTTYFSIANYTLKISIRGAHLKFQNLFDGDEKLTQSIQKIVNDNWDVIFDDVKDDVERNSAEVCRILTKKLFDNIPVDQIFLK